MVDTSPVDAFARAQVLQWMFFEQYSHEPYIAVARFIQRYLGNPPEHAERARRCVQPGYAALDVMERHLAARSYFVGERCSVAGAVRRDKILVRRDAGK